MQTTAQMTDIKEYFQQLQMQSPQSQQILQTSQETLNVVESSSTSRSSGEEMVDHPRNSSPIDILGTSIEQKEPDKETWDMRSYIQSLPTRADMDLYVHRLEKSY